MWRVARDSGKLDLNSSYAYLMWCRDFAETSVVARMGSDGTAVVGFVTGYIRPQAPETLVVWQVAVDAAYRGYGLAGRMLHRLADRLVPQGASALETTITPANEASIALFNGFARGRSAEISREELFPADVFPDEHETEILFRISPLYPAPTL